MRRCVFVIIALCALLGVACSKSARGYSGDTEGAFMESCTVRQGQPERVCKCTYDEITRQLSFDRYVEIDKQLQADPEAVPDELVHIVADCGSRATSTTTSSASSSSSSSTSASSSSTGTSSSSSSSSPN